ncbi:hypothetical protein AC578_6978 [Pseudocercospora eumusae]|uniref:Uncharacterized protein n=1 Tax=Pseudocercospora eumusae TaxID=321146 RepID=A0A139GZB5_9PEZI|nr:hypothetical protein AC578_6978 [Pseudocercospora eumusae]
MARLTDVVEDEGTRMKCIVVAERHQSHYYTTAADAAPQPAIHDFQTLAPSKHIERMQRARKEKDELGIALSELFLGISIKRKDDQEVDIGFACSDGTYNIDFAVHTLDEHAQEVSDRLKCNVALPPSKVK